MVRDLAVVWGKAGVQPVGHPLLFHMLDVGGVGAWLWSDAMPRTVRSRVADALGLDEDETRRFVGACCALHDLGKASPAFQAKRADLTVAARAAGLPFPSEDLLRAKATSALHGAATAITLPDVLASRLGLPRVVARGWAMTVAAHHGSVPTPSELDEAENFPTLIGAGGWDGLRGELLDDVLAAFDIGTAGGRLAEPLDAAAAFAIAGLCSVADWIGSGDAFAYLPDTQLDEYLRLFADRTDAGIARVHWKRWRPIRGQSSEDRLGVVALRPIQQAASEIARELGGPGLVIIESPMGEGKTEAAWELAYHLAVSLDLGGLYTALPTRATSNAMQKRLADFLVRCSLDAEGLLQTVHGMAGLVAHDVNDGADDVRASEWFCGRSRGLLAPVGVGTIDQALLAVLRCRHWFVRLFGLAQKVVVVDEVHAYDTYMSTVLDRLLEWLGMLGVPVVLLSATLPTVRRHELLAAYHADGDRAAVGDASAGSRISWAGPNGRGERSVGVSARSVRDVHVQLAEGMDERALAAWLLPQLDGGGCVAVIRNTVARAQATYLALSDAIRRAPPERQPVLELFHARFPADDRAIIEGRVVDQYGNDPARRPERAIVVATQVVEQSLDLDFDLMVSDHAPIDLLLQRSGRLHRFAETLRPAALIEPRLVLTGFDIDPAGVPTFPRSCRLVYDHHLLLRTWATLRFRTKIVQPADLGHLVDLVYGDSDIEHAAVLDVVWDATANELRSTIETNRFLANTHAVPTPSDAIPLWQFGSDAGEEDAPDLHPALQALTRLGPPSVSVVVVWDRGGCRYALTRDGSETFDLGDRPNLTGVRRLLGRSVDLSHRAIVGPLLDRVEVPDGWKRSPWLRRHRPLALTSDGTARFDGWQVRLHSQLGLVIERTDR